MENSKTTLSDKIMQEILKAWQDGHGGSAEEVLLFQGAQGLILLIPQALYQAELDLYKNSLGGGRVLNKYLRTLLHTVASEFLPLSEEITGNEVDEVIPLIDLKAGWAMAFYRTK
ncbi:MAG: hypothetical protein JW757_04350 [Anaerolineales bacterium]|nr:hypothetical protein [Anaerolineales bacterium]